MRKTFLSFAVISALVMTVACGAKKEIKFNTLDKTGKWNEEVFEIKGGVYKDTTASAPDLDDEKYSFVLDAGVTTNVKINGNGEKLKGGDKITPTGSWSETEDGSGQIYDVAAHIAAKDLAEKKLYAQYMLDGGGEESPKNFKVTVLYLTQPAGYTECKQADVEEIVIEVEKDKTIASIADIDKIGSVSFSSANAQSTTNVSGKITGSSDDKGIYSPVKTAWYETAKTKTSILLADFSKAADGQPFKLGPEGTGTAVTKDVTIICKYTVSYE